MSARRPQRPTAPEPAPPHPAGQVLLVTGRAGAGRSTALNKLEDLGFRTVDTPPLDMVLEMVRAEFDQAEPDGGPRRLAIGLDARTRGFSPAAFRALNDQLKRLDGVAASLLFLDSSDETLLRRYTETRRRHPLAPDAAIGDGIARDRQEMAPLRDAADMVIDTSAMAPREFGRVLQERFGSGDGPGLALTVLSFSYRGGLPAEADFVFDCRFLRNPHYIEALCPQDGRDAAVAAYVAGDPNYPAFLALLGQAATTLLPAFAAEGKSYVTVAFGCTGGQHRSVAVAEAFAALARERGWRPMILHREQAAEPREPRARHELGARRAAV